MPVNKIVSFLLCFLIIVASGFPADNSPPEKYVPPDEPAPAIFEEEGEKPGLVPWGIVSITAAAGGLTMTGFGIHAILENMDAGFESADLQSGIILAAGGGLITAAASVFLGIILPE